MNSSDAKPRLLLISDQPPASNHSAVEGLFGRSLTRYFDVQVVYFGRDCKRTTVEGSRITVPHAARRRRLVPSLPLGSRPDDFDLVVVRNLFPVLRAVQRQRKNPQCRIGFWESFPHSYRRVVQAEITGRAKWRIKLEYALARRQQAALVEACDFYLPISATYVDIFRPSVAIPWHPTSLGIDRTTLPQPSSYADRDGGPRRFIYVGAVGLLRRTDEIFELFAARREAFQLDIYTADRNEQVDRLRRMDPRIRVHAALPREQLLQRMAAADVGISTIPEIPLYAVSSPTKSMEYAAVGLPVLMTRLPEHLRLFDDQSALMCSFEAASIDAAIGRALSASRDELRAIGDRARESVMRQREYVVLADQLADFLTSQFAQRLSPHLQAG